MIEVLNAPKAETEAKRTETSDNFKADRNANQVALLNAAAQLTNISASFKGISA